MRITEEIEISERELEERFIRASGPGGQNVNKVSTAVELRFDIRHSGSLPLAVRDRLVRIAGRRINEAGVLVIRADRFRTQDRNRSEALARLVDMVERASHRPKPRKKTKVPKAVKMKRLDNKARRGDVKSKRGRVRDHD